LILILADDENYAFFPYVISRKKEIEITYSFGLIERKISLIFKRNGKSYLFIYLK